MTGQLAFEKGRVDARLDDRVGFARLARCKFGSLEWHDYARVVYWVDESDLGKKLERVEQMTDEEYTAAVTAAKLWELVG